MRSISLLVALFSVSVFASEFDYLYPKHFLNYEEAKSIVNETERILSLPSAEIQILLTEKDELKRVYLLEKKQCNQNIECVRAADNTLKKKLKIIQKKIKIAAAKDTIENRKKELRKVLLATMGAVILNDVKKAFEDRAAKGELILETDIFFNRARTTRDIIDAIGVKDVNPTLIVEGSAYIEFFFRTSTFEKNIKLLSTGFADYSTYDVLANSIKTGYYMYGVNSEKLFNHLYSNKSTNNRSGRVTDLKIEIDCLSIYFVTDSINF